MDRSQRLAIDVGIGLTVLVVGCLPPPLPPPEEVLRALSQAILQPATTCAELRTDFGLDDLPLVDTPDQIGIPYDETTLEVGDGETLRVWYMPAASENGTVVVSPGNTGPMPCYLFTARLLTESGWSVVMYDYEGFGGSSGVPALTALRDDLEHVVDWARQRTGHESVTLFGMSLGSIPSIAVAIDRPDAVNGVILDSPVALATEIERFSFLIRGRAAEVIAIIGDLAPWLLTERTVGRLEQPLLVFMHELDVITPPRTVKLLFEQAAGPKEMVFFAGLDHAAGQFEQTEQYQARLVEFLTSLANE